MRGAEHRGVDMVLLEPAVHILVIHAPYARVVLDQGAVDDAVAVALKALGKADVGGGVEQHAAALGAEYVQGADHTAQNTVFVADVLPLEVRRAVAAPLPVEDGVEVGVGGEKVAVGRVLSPLDDGLGDRWHGGEVHVGHPHGDLAEALPHLGSLCGDDVQGQGVPAAAVNDTGKIVLHYESASLFCTLGPGTIPP